MSNATVTSDCHKTRGKQGHDYEAAKLLRLKGFSYRQIAEQTGIPHDNLRATAARHKWADACDNVNKAVAQTVASRLGAESERHLLNMSSVATDALAQVAESVRSKPKLSDLEKLAHIADTFDRVARRTYGLDKQESQTHLHLGVVLQGNSPQRQVQAIVDVEATPVLEAEQVQGEAPNQSTGGQPTNPT